MKMRCLALLLLAVLIMTGCTAAPGTSPATAATDAAEEAASAENTEIEEKGEEHPEEDVPAGGTGSPASVGLEPEDTVEIVIPTVYESVTSQEEADEIRDKNGYISAVLLEDGSLKIVMSREKHEEMMKQFRQSVDDAIAEIVRQDGSKIEKIEYNNDYSEFTVTVSGDEIGDPDRQTAEELIMYGTLYHIYSGNETDHIQVNYVSGESGDVIESADSGSLEKAY